MYPIGKRFQPFNMPSAHYNLDYLQQVFQGNDAMVHRILDSFEEQVPAYFAEMDKRWHEGRWQDIHPLAHKAKSSIGMLGMTLLLEHVVHIERVSRTAADPDDMRDRLDQARTLLDLALDAMRRDRAGQAGGGAGMEGLSPLTSESRRIRRRLRRA